jgi:WD40 repeat protein
MYHKQGIENAPLQAYGSALLFSPTGSLIRKLFQDEEPEHVKIKPSMADSWSACLQTLEGHSSSVNSVTFSHDSTQLASASADKTVKIWDVSSGACLQTLNMDRILYNISFDGTSSYLHSDIGTIAPSSSGTSNTISTVVTPQLPPYQYTGLSSDNIWITFDSKNLLRLPQEYRPSVSAVLGNTLGIGVGSGKVWLCTVDFHKP